MNQKIRDATIKALGGHTAREMRAERMDREVMSYSFGFLFRLHGGLRQLQALGERVQGLEKFFSGDVVAAGGTHYAGGLEVDGAFWVRADDLAEILSDWWADSGEKWPGGIAALEALGRDIADKLEEARAAPERFQPGEFSGGDERLEAGGSSSLSIEEAAIQRLRIATARVCEMGDSHGGGHFTGHIAPEFQRRLIELKESWDWFDGDHAAEEADPRDGQATAARLDEGAPASLEESPSRKALAVAVELREEAPGPLVDEIIEHLEGATE